MAISLTPKGDGEIHVYRYDAFDEEVERDSENSQDGVINPVQRKQLPANLREFLGMDTEYESDEGFVDNFRIL
mgnify:CR=1 FL=1